jgi:peroxiredoxin
MALQKGDTAPHIKLYSEAKEKVEINFPANENYLLLFFPLAFSPVCTDEMCFIRDEIELYDEWNAEVYGISVDSPYALAKFKEEKELPFTLLSDFNREVSRAYDALYEVFAMDLRGVSKRAAFVINKAGRIHYAEVLEDAGQVPNFTAIKNILKKLNK